MLAGFQAAWRSGFLARQRAARPPATPAGRRAGRQEGGGKAGGGREGRGVGRRAGRRRKTEDVFLFPEDGRRKSYAFRLPVLRLPSSGIRPPSSALRLPGIRKTSSAVRLVCGRRKPDVFRLPGQSQEDGRRKRARNPAPRPEANELHYFISVAQGHGSRSTACAAGQQARQPVSRPRKPASPASEASPASQASATSQARPSEPSEPGMARQRSQRSKARPSQAKPGQARHVGVPAAKSLRAAALRCEISACAARVRVCSGAPGPRRCACPPIYCYGPVSPALPTGCSVRPLGALVLFSSGPAPRPTHWGPPSWQPRGLPNRTGPTLGAAVPKQGLESGTKNRREGVSTDSTMKWK